MVRLNPPYEGGVHQSVAVRWNETSGEALIFDGGLEDHAVASWRTSARWILLPWGFGFRGVVAAPVFSVLSLAGVRRSYCLGPKHKWRCRGWDRWAPNRVGRSRRRGEGRPPPRLRRKALRIEGRAGGWPDWRPSTMQGRARNPS